MRDLNLDYVGSKIWVALVPTLCSNMNILKCHLSRTKNRTFEKNRKRKVFVSADLLELIKNLIL